MAIGQCIRHIRSITDVGYAPYELIRTILMKIENPSQLKKIEKKSPHIADEDEELWMSFIARDIPQWQTRLVRPKDPKNWHKEYRRMLDQVQAEIKKDTEILRAAMQGIAAERAKHTSRIVDASTVPRLPKDPGMMNHDGGKPISGRRSKSSHEAGLRDSLVFGAGSRTKTNTGASMLLKVRREAREMSLFSQRNSVLSTPTHLLNRTTPSTLKNKKRSYGPTTTVTASPKIAPPSSRGPPKASGEPKYLSHEELMAAKEAKLRSLTAPQIAGVKRDGSGFPVAHSRVGRASPLAKSAVLETNSKESRPKKRQALPNVSPIVEKKPEVDIFIRRPHVKRPALGSGILQSKTGSEEKPEADISNRRSHVKRPAQESSISQPKAGGGKKPEVDVFNRRPHVKRPALESSTSQPKITGSEKKPIAQQSFSKVAPPARISGIKRDRLGKPISS
ncbi:MAG: hypothetical protein M1829_003572 [Trizodia sp. TS-e1964]|nr:MAG: hypothetical protein M1829_003572 [Trizodia sp. TS-e1964]